MINKVILIGNVGADPEVRALEGGVKVARIRLATTERIYNRATQESRDHTEWHNLTLWRNLADIADRFVRKGSRIYIEGKLRSREWTDDSGNKRYGIEIVVDDLKLLDRRPEGGVAPLDGTTYVQQAQQRPQYQAQSQPQRQPQAPVVDNDDPDDLPF